MGIGHKSSCAQIFRLMVYRRALHPELFNFQGRSSYSHGDYEAECWIIPCGHVVRFQVDNDLVTETMIENGDHLPELGLVHVLPCLGEKEFELGPEGRLHYMTTVQIEALTDSLYQSTSDEMRDFAAEAGALSFSSKAKDGSTNFSVLDAQKYKREFHIQSYHLIGPLKLVVRTQSIFEVV